MAVDYYLSDLIGLGPTPNMGRGVFALADLPAGLLLETSPVIVMTKAHQELIDQTPLHDYIFLWGPDETRCAMALGYVSLYNHAPQSNCDYLMDFEQQTISIITVKDIKEGEELFINYNGDSDDDRPVWFPLSP
ncbi:hypothetical protein SAMN05444008_102281 [Cnuella takakiae]|uniref:SET domain-containing protein n=1 Tax=Cnuella takakiae TaxID=1302690 RepID=A0A1M4VJ56_9BACT|nr:SET domain-containing protein [Cnuella takakiae]OLY92583.1 SET domain-containing protein-lysine N-methyltransferase [Cnuella takakiae]SHE68910.1 hypothetical protein SAMN05444008_102281 [Cnuella takakiae]